MIYPYLYLRLANDSEGYLNHEKGGGTVDECMLGQVQWKVSGTGDDVGEVTASRDEESARTLPDGQAMVDS